MIPSFFAFAYDPALSSSSIKVNSSAMASYSALTAGCLSIFLSRPCLELIEQGFGSWLIDFGLILKGRFKSGSQFITRWGPRQGFGADG